MDAEIIAVGSEMLTPQRVDTNSLYLTGELNRLGVEVVAKCVIGDNRERLADAIRRAVSRSAIVIVSGGLGPTEDDVTREAVALALDRKLLFRPEIADALEQRFGVELSADRKETLESFCEMGLLKEDGMFIRATPRGRLVLDEICARLV